MIVTNNIYIAMGDVVEWMDRRGVNVEYRYNKVVAIDHDKITLDLDITITLTQIINVYNRKG